MPARDFLPVPVVELRLDDPTSVVATNAEGRALVLVRLHGVPLGTLEERGGPATAPVRREHAVAALEGPVLRHLERDGLTLADLEGEAAAVARTPCRRSPAPSTTRVAVVVCTLGRDPRLVGAVRSVLDQTHPAHEVVVVDNDPASGRARRLLADVDDPRLRVVDEARRGLSAARNRGVAAIAAPVVAFTDDDAEADPGWLERLVGPLDAHPEVVCVTGLVLPAALETPAQLWFEEFGAFGKGFEATVWSTVDGGPALAGAGRRGQGGALFPYAAGMYGSGNNMAFRRDWLLGHPFDEALGAGTLPRGGEDLDAFLAVLLGGRALFYEPAALVRHHARSDLAGLRAQMFGYGSGMAAVVAKQVVRPRHGPRILRRLPAGLVRLLDPRSAKNSARSSSFPTELVRAELLGYAAGPVLYARARWRARRR